MMPRRRMGGAFGLRFAAAQPSAMLERMDRSPLQPFLDRQGLVLLDGGLATELERRGFDLDDPLWSGRLVLEAPEAIEAVHEDYLEAGADVITSASYQLGFEGLGARGLDVAEAAEVMRRSVAIALRARDRFWARPASRAGRLRPLVAASIGPYGAVLADGSEYRGDYSLDRNRLRDFHRARLELLSDAGADLLAVETLPCRREAEAIVDLLAERPGPPAWLSFSCRDGRHLSSGEEFGDAVEAVAGAPRVLALGINCSAPRHLPSLLSIAAGRCDLPLMAYPNRGERWDAAAGGWHPGEGDAVGTDELAVMARDWQTAGARLIGGCCRTGPEDIRAMRVLLLDAS